MEYLALQIALELVALADASTDLDERIGYLEAAERVLHAGRVIAAIPPPTEAS